MDFYLLFEQVRKTNVYMICFDLSCLIDRHTKYSRSIKRQPRKHTRTHTHTHTYTYTHAHL